MTMHPDDVDEVTEETPVDPDTTTDETEVAAVDEIPELVDEAPELDEDEVAEGVDEAPEVDEAAALRDELAAAHARAAALEAELAEQARQIEAARPTVDVSKWLWESHEDVIEFYGMDKLREIVDQRIATENKKRTRQGFDRLSYTPEERQEMVGAVVAELLADRLASGPPEEGPLMRTLKMVSPAGELVQIPYEEQVNNIAGSLADGRVRYETKGYKRTRPALCPAKDCFRPAAVEDGKFLYFGYCSENHRARTEPAQQRGEAVAV